MPSDSEDSVRIFLDRTAPALDLGVYQENMDHMDADEDNHETLASSAPLDARGYLAALENVQILSEDHKIHTEEQVLHFDSVAAKDKALAKTLRDTTRSMRRVRISRTSSRESGDVSELLEAWSNFNNEATAWRLRLTNRALLNPESSASVIHTMQILEHAGSRSPSSPQVKAHLDKMASLSKCSAEFMKGIKTEEERIAKMRSNGPSSVVGQNDAARLDTFFNERTMFGGKSGGEKKPMGSITQWLTYLEQKGGPYMWLARKCTAFKATVLFQTIIIFVICTAGLADGVATYDVVGNDGGFIIFQGSLLFVFILEMLVKVVSAGYHPWRYFTGFRPDPPDGYSASEEASWNCFDCLIVCVGIAEMTGAGQGLSFLRLLRLLRVLRLLKFWTELQMIISGLIGGIKASVAIVALIFFVVFLYGTLGATTFGKNDPVHFGNLFKSMNTLYLVSNYEWLDLLYINMFSCANYPAGIYEDKNEYHEEAQCRAAFTSASVTLQNLGDTAHSNLTFLGMGDTCARQMVEEITSDEATYEFNSKTVCLYPSEQRIAAAIFFISYIILMSMVRNMCCAVDGCVLVW
jgi:hypothetical protein